jgi:uncharacterized protein YwgA
MSLLFSNDLCSAYVTEIVKAFQALKPTGYLGRTALQKLTYFSKAIGVPIPCSFEIYNYGPYSEEVTRSVTALLADEALQDVSFRPAYSSYKPGANATEFSPEFIGEVSRHKELINSIVEALGSAKPETLELIATLHFVNARQKGILSTQPSEQQVTTEFRTIKGNKFSAEEIHQWFEWLKSSGLL